MPQEPVNDDEAGEAGGADDADDRSPTLPGTLRAKLLAHRTAMLCATLAERPDLALRW